MLLAHHQEPLKTYNQMKIEITQLQEPTRNILALAMEHYALTVGDGYPEIAFKYTSIAQAIRHGELLLCEYVYTPREGGGNHVL